MKLTFAGLWNQFGMNPSATVQATVDLARQRSQDGRYPRERCPLTRMSWLHAPSLNLGLCRPMVYSIGFLNHCRSMESIFAGLWTQLGIKSFAAVQASMVGPARQRSQEMRYPRERCLLMRMSRYTYRLSLNRCAPVYVHSERILGPIKEPK
jgi:hypothetical protein